MQGRAVVWGRARGEVLFIEEPLSFFGGVNPKTGEIIQDRHPQKGHSVAGRIVLMERSTGSTVGAYSLLRLRDNGVAPAAIVAQQADTVLSTGAALANIPLVDLIEIKEFSQNTELEVAGGWVGEPGQAPDITNDGPESEEMALITGVVIKLGGSVITEKNSDVPVIRRDIVLRLSQEIGRFHGSVAIVHGAGSFGHPLAARLIGQPLDDTLRLAWSELQTLQYRLNSEIADALRFAGIPVYPLQASVLGAHWQRHIADTTRTIVEHGFVPLLYGTPVILQDGPAILSGDDLVYSIAQVLGYRYVIHVTDQPGVYDRPPDKNGAILLDRIRTMKDFDAEMLTHDVTGGIASKVRKALAASTRGIMTRVVNGLQPGELLEALRGGSVGTLIG